MSIATLILGESGSGKSASLRNLDPANTLLIQAVRKPLPFKAAGWEPYSRKTGKGNVITNDNPNIIERAMRTMQRPVVILDDWQYILANEFMRRSDETGFQKFTDIGKNGWNIVRAASELHPNVRVYILAHTATNDVGEVRIKTIGKLLDEKITVEGLFTIVLRTSVADGTFRFSTVNNGRDTVKSPIGMFDNTMIENDLAVVDKAICDYYDLTNELPAQQPRPEAQAA